MTIPSQPSGNWLDQLRLQQTEPVAYEPQQTQEEFNNSNNQSETELEPNEGIAPDGRRALVSLLRHGVILATDRNKLYEALCRHQCKIRRFLADVYLQLVLDERAGVAFVASIDSEDDSLDEGEEVISLINKRTLSLYDTLVLLILRKHFQERETAGEQRIVIDVEKIESHLSPFLPLLNSDSKAKKQLLTTLVRFKEKRILNTVRGSEERFEITPVIRYVVSAEFLEQLLAEYLKLAQQQGIEMIEQGEGDE